jgi:hypothetical protein
MTHPLHGAIAIAAALIAGAPLVAQAQASAPAAKAGAYPSAFDGYRRFDEQKLQPWREANDTVGRIGGWRAYARESAGEEMPPVKAPEAAKPASMPHRGHHGDKGHSMHHKP